MEYIGEKDFKHETCIFYLGPKLVASLNKYTMHKIISPCSISQRGTNRHSTTEKDIHEVKVSRPAISCPNTVQDEAT